MASHPTGEQLSLPGLFGPSPRPAPEPPSSHTPLTLPKPRPSSAAPRDEAEAQARREFEEKLAAHTQLRWHVCWTEQRRTMVSFNRHHRPPILRLHALFIEAPAPLIARVAEVIEGRKRAWGKEMDLFLRTTLAKPIWSERRADVRRPALHRHGEVYEVEGLFATLNDLYFGGRLQVNLGWMVPAASRRGLKLGSYSETTRTIRLHPALDDARVPAFVVEAVLFHEMAHAALLTGAANGRRVIHGAAFKREVARYPQTAEADRWIAEHIRELLSRAKKKRVAQKRKVDKPG